MLLGVYSGFTRGLPWWAMRVETAHMRGKT
jgi:hypothetical protein